MRILPELVGFVKGIFQKYAALKCGLSRCLHHAFVGRGHDRADHVKASDILVIAESWRYFVKPTLDIAQRDRRGGASRSELEYLIAGGNHSMIYMTPPYNQRI